MSQTAATAASSRNSIGRTLAQPVVRATSAGGHSSRSPSGMRHGNNPANCGASALTSSAAPFERGAGTDPPDQDGVTRPQGNPARRIHGHRHPEVDARGRELEVRRHDPRVPRKRLHRASASGRRPQDRLRSAAAKGRDSAPAAGAGAGALVVEAEARTHHACPAHTGQQVPGDLHHADCATARRIRVSVTWFGGRYAETVERAGPHSRSSSSSPM